MSNELETGDQVTDPSYSDYVGAIRVVLEDLTWVTWTNAAGGKLHTVEFVNSLTKIVPQWQEGDYLRKQSLGLDRTYHVVHVFEDGGAIAWYQQNLKERGTTVFSAEDRADFRMPTKVPGEVDILW